MSELDEQCPECGAGPGRVDVNPLSDADGGILHCLECGADFSPEPPGPRSLSERFAIRMVAGTFTLAWVLAALTIARGYWFISIRGYPPTDEQMALYLQNPLMFMYGSFITAMANVRLIALGSLAAFVLGCVVVRGLDWADPRTGYSGR